MKIRSFSGVAALAALLTTLFAAPAMALSPGDPAPEFSLKDCMGNAVNLADHKGKVVVLEWTNPECPYVQMHYGERTTMNDLSKKFSADGSVVWLRINSTSTMKEGECAAWCTEQGITANYLIDTDGAVGMAYGAKTTPHMFVIDKDGKIAYNGAIDNGPNYPETEINYVDNAVTAVMAGNKIEVAETKPYGCTVKYAKGAKEKAGMAKKEMSNKVKGAEGAPVEMAGGKEGKGKGGL